MAKVLATDLDGTLMFPKRIFRCIPKKNINFLRKWIDAGNKLVLVTSRGYSYMDRLKKEILRDFDSVTCTASYIVINNKVVKDNPIPTDVLKTVVNDIIAKFQPKALLITTEKYPLVIKNVSVRGSLFKFFYHLYWRSQHKRRETYVLNNDIFDDEINNGKVYKIMVFFGLGRSKKKISKEINKEIHKQFDNIESSWSSIINEITPLNCNKGSGLKEYCDHNSIDPNDVYVVGDSGNDISMFKNFYENSYVMKKAYPSVKKYASHSVRRVYKLDKILEKEN